MISLSSSRIKIFAHFVQDLATLSKCTDKHVAAIIINEDASQVLSVGVNGGPIGGIQCLCTLGGKYTCVHAEANALAKCKQDCKGATMICSLGPCVTCATLIINAGISHVLYLKAYKDNTGLEMLRHAGVRVYAIDTDIDLEEEPIK